MGESASFFYGSHTTPLHSHITLQLIIDLKGTLLLRTAHSSWKNYSTELISENAIHQLNTNQSLQLIIYIDPSSETGKALKNRFLRGNEFCNLSIVFDPLEEALIYNGLVRPEQSSVKLISRLIFRKINEISNHDIKDKKIITVLSLIKHSPSAELGIKYLASKVFISPSRLRMQFKQLLGISLHQYILDLQQKSGQVVKVQ